MGMPLTLAMTDDGQVAIVAIVIGGSLLVAVISVITKAVTTVVQTKAREESRREIAAYVAEGSIAPDEAAKILAAGTSNWKDFLKGKG